MDASSIFDLILKGLIALTVWMVVTEIINGR